MTRAPINGRQGRCEEPAEDRDCRDYNQRRREAANVSDKLVSAALHASVPGGSTVAAWLPQKDAWTLHETARDVIRCAIEEAILLDRAARAQSGAAS